MAKYIKRSIEKKLNELKGHFPVILVTGSRQSGKTTLLEHLTINDKISFVTLDDYKERINAIEDPEMFLRNHETPLIIDEIQYAPNLLSYIKMNIDSARKNEMFGDGKKVGTMYYLTGSRVFQTMEEVSESLAGRVAIVDLYPLSTREIDECEDSLFIPDINKLRNKKTVKQLSTKKVFDRIHKGSYPETYKDKNINMEVYFSSYIKTYLERDVRQIITVKDEIKFLKFISCVAARTGEEYNASDIAENVGVDNSTIDSWMSVLVNTYIVTLLYPHQNNNVRKIIKRPKIIFMDTGLACYLTGYVDSNTLQRSIYSGQIFETYIISEVIKSYTNNLKDPRKHLYYYRDSKGKEIDLLIVEEDNIYPVEIKKSANPGYDCIKNFDVVKKFEMNSPNGIVICMTREIHAINDNNYLIPIEYI